jgi:hypothetical protein
LQVERPLSSRPPGSVPRSVPCGGLVAWPGPCPRDLPPDESCEAWVLLIVGPGIDGRLGGVAGFLFFGGVRGVARGVWWGFVCGFVRGTPGVTMGVVFVGVVGVTTGVVSVGVVGVTTGVVSVGVVGVPVGVELGLVFEPPFLPCRECFALELACAAAAEAAV